MRPLYEDAAADNAAVTRDYVLALDEAGPPLLSIYGGKITTFRRLAEHALDRARDHLPMGPAWTRDAPLPGGDMIDFGRFFAQLCAERPWLPAATAHRLARAYGTRVDEVLGGARTLDALGPLIGGTLSRAEIRYLVEREWARTAEDVLWRRSKLGLHLGADEQQQVAEWIAEETGAGLEPLAQATR